MKRMARPERKLAAAPAAALAALSVALMLSVPAAALSAEQPRTGSNREAIASLIETLNDAARTLAGVSIPHAGHTRPVAVVPTPRPVDHAAPADHARPHAQPLRDALRNLPPPAVSF